VGVGDGEGVAVGVAAGGAEALRYVRSKIPDAVRNPAFAAYIERALTPFRRRPTQQRPASLAAPSKL